MKNILIVLSLFSILSGCLLYTSDAADERSSVDLGGRRIIQKKNTIYTAALAPSQTTMKYITRVTNNY